MKYLPYVIIVILLITCFFQHQKVEVKPEVIIKRDTIYKTDTIYKEKPVYKTLVKVEKDTVYVHDTIRVILDRETKIYEDSTYSLQISGINADLDWIKTYPTTKYIYEEKVVQMPYKQPLFEFKPSIGVGYGLLNNKIDIYVGGSLQINLNRNKK